MSPYYFVFTATALIAFNSNKIQVLFDINISVWNNKLLFNTHGEPHSKFDLDILIKKKQTKFRTGV